MLTDFTVFTVPDRLLDLNSENVDWANRSQKTTKIETKHDAANRVTPVPQLPFNKAPPSNPLPFQFEGPWEVPGVKPHPSRVVASKSPGSWRFGSRQGWERPLFTGLTGRFFPHHFRWDVVLGFHHPSRVQIPRKLPHMDSPPLKNPRIRKNIRWFTILKLRSFIWIQSSSPPGWWTIMIWLHIHMKWSSTVLFYKTI